MIVLLYENIIELRKNSFLSYVLVFSFLLVTYIESDTVDLGL